MIKNLLGEDEPESPRDEGPVPAASSGSGVLGLLDSNESRSEPKTNDQADYQPSSTEPQSMSDSVRGMGLAYSAGIAFTAAVVFMLVLGWGADVLLGTSPWGIVGGILLGSVIGFVQFFRITSQIFKK
ncbi:MAG TPA: AtpZ/AtpI family protein [Pyrinomonadaceae bacterium]|nr:AtpZ/AtpI family protein [Pyrinomonadaceae bacterium]